MQEIPSGKDMPGISVIGLGKLGACAAACFASKGFSTIGVEIDQACVDSVNRGLAPVQEPGLQEFMDRAGDRLAATPDYRRAFEESDITFLIVPTPSREDGHFSNEFLEHALERLSLALKDSLKKYHLFVVSSTVSPGSINGKLIPLVEAVSCRKLNRDFGFCYNPEFIALGSVIKDTLNPDMVLIGQSSPEAGDRVEEIYRVLCENTPYIARMSITSAEVAKIGLNAYVTMKISFANTLASICEKVAGTEIDKITDALGADKRISPYYLKGGLMFGGPCFPRDNRAFAAFTGQYGIEASLANATDQVNQCRRDILINRILAHVRTHKCRAVSLLGLTYKPGTPVMDESPAIPVIRELLKNGLDVTVYDPLAMDNARKIFKDDISYSGSIGECIACSNTCVVMTNDNAFINMELEYFRGGPRTVIDCWRILGQTGDLENVEYIALGEHTT